MGESLQTGQVRAPQLVRAAEVAHEAEVRQSANGVRFATYGETGVPAPDLDRMLEAVPAGIASALEDNTYYFVPLALREKNEAEAETAKSPEPAMVAGAYTDEYGEEAICHRNVDLESGRKGVFISTRLMSDRFALSFEFFINVAHAYVDRAGVAEKFAELVWKQATENVRGETSLDAWESRNVAFGRAPDAMPEPQVPSGRRNRTFVASARPFTSATVAAAAPVVAGDKERAAYLEAAFSDAIAIYLLSLALDFEYGELREREYPLLAPAALAARLRLVSELFPPNPSYEFSVRYRRRA